MTLRSVLSAFILFASSALLGACTLSREGVSIDPPAEREHSSYRHEELQKAKRLLSEPATKLAHFPLRPEEVERILQINGPELIAVRYQLKAEGFPLDTEYSLRLGLQDGPERTFEKLSVRETDNVVSTRHGSPFEFVLVRHREQIDEPTVLDQVPEGYSYHLMFASVDGRILAMASLVPFPFVAYGEGGCRITSLRGLPYTPPIDILAAGFEPNEKVRIVAKSDGEIICSAELPTRTDGQIQFSFLPPMLGRRHGLVDVMATGERCSVTLQIPWGDLSLETE